MGSAGDLACTANVSVVVDDRETGSGVLRALRDLTGVKVTVRRLPLGDYEVDGRILFERKTLLDLAESIKDGRLFRQACRLAASPKKTAILLEGTAVDLAASHMSREAIQGALITLSVILGIPLLRSFGPEESVRLGHSVCWRDLARLKVSCGRNRMISVRCAESARRLRGASAGP